MDDAHYRLERATNHAIETGNASERASVLWSMSYTEHETRQESRVSDGTQKLFVIDQSTYDVACDDSILDSVKMIWSSILGEKAAEYDFLRFEERKDAEDDQ